MPSGAAPPSSSESLAKCRTNDRVTASLNEPVGGNRRKWGAMNVPSQIPRLAGVVAAAVGGIALLGWLFDVPILTSVVPRLAPIQFNAAVSFVLLGAALALLAGSPAGRA